MDNIRKSVYPCNGYILLSASLMLTAFMSVILICSFVAGYGSENDFRYVTTRLSIKKIKQALLGEKYAAPGFISDYGEPDNITPFAPGTNNFIGTILNRQSVAAWKQWSYSGPPEEFWAGYRGVRYFMPSPGEWSDDPPFPHDLLDGWGHPIEVTFVQDSTPEHTVIEIKSNGSDGSSGGTENYKEDVEETFYWKRSVNLTLAFDAGSLGLPDGTDVDIEVILVYPFHGAAALKNQTKTLTITGGVGSCVYDFPVNPPGDMNPQKFSVGHRKMLFILNTDLSPWGGPLANALLADRIIPIPSCPVVSNPPDPPDPFRINVDLAI